MNEVFPRRTRALAACALAIALAGPAENTKKIVFVMKGGQLVDESKLPLAGVPQPRRFTP